ncbi:MAG: putative uncharacterized phage protein [Massilia sp.]|nr:putative uncharacterized phage protein [Massilia sp.]
MPLNTTKFGLKSSYDLFGKLKYDSKLLLRQRPENDEERRLEEYEAFNFFVTAWHLHKDWLGSDSIDKPVHSLAKITVAHAHVKEIRHAIRDIANGSKHFSLNDSPKVSVGEREISSWYSYFFGAQYTVDTKSFHFLLYELVGIVMEYFEWIFDDKISNSVPATILEKLEKANELRVARYRHSRDGS